MDNSKKQGIIDKIRMKLVMFLIHGTSAWKVAEKEQKIRDGLACNFCGKTEEDVKRLIAGPSVFICNECIKLCNDILKDEEHDIHNGG